MTDRTAAARAALAANPERIRRGENHPRAKLLQSDVTEMKARFADGASIASLARAYGVDRRTVRRVLVGESWKPAPEPVELRQPERADWPSAGEVRLMYAAGLSAEEVAKHFSMGLDAVEEIINT
jgi:DNA invertase Pin-like site-specific DNA recombinase